MNQRGECSRQRSRCVVAAQTGGATLRTGLLFGALPFATGAAGLAGQETEDCGADVPLGVAVLDESGSIPIPFATVRLTSEDEGALDGPLRGQAGADGRLVLCVPVGVGRATLWAEFGDAASDETEVPLQPGAVQDVVLRLRVASVENGRLLGTVTDALSDAPVSAAAVSLRGRPQAVQTNRQGGFILSDVPVGVYELSVRHLGYAPLRHMVNVARGATTDIQIGLVPAPLEMEPLVATAVRLRRLEIKGFYERKRWGELLGLGTFYTAADIERRHPGVISDMVMEEASIRRYCRVGSRTCRLYSTRLASGSGSRCHMQIYLDGVHISSLGEADLWVSPVEIGGVEVYKGPASLPAEFGGSSSRCGVVAIWTK
ncbi:MAG: carboxypeptidase regulatory-like domain-containing protein [Gemmatimonadota bacterium]|uniref:carboxypeptidase regulatory-like domain-containing protein n=1 Tax=Candidatus Palauibacter scopulicola TaxID=3056741 RepID=UPI00239FE42B|nr:carboxypeptidase regulatory-like domain-containing protein [Candidatus Palauibacter scopulicola]MDE2662824.1 carboxypeptidase regulatory-like domain-containing protein [Candidatus Palauibacter scopulicola]